MRILKPTLLELMVSFGQLRRQVDIELQRLYPTANGKLYPLGRCDKISNAVLRLLRQELCATPSGGLAILATFLRAGGMLRSIWGVLRDWVFQNAIQLGGFILMLPMTQSI